jgi:hypothetical protein
LLSDGSDGSDEDWIGFLFGRRRKMEKLDIALELLLLDFASFVFLFWMKLCRNVGSEP